MDKNELIKRLKEQETAHQVDDYSEGYFDGISVAIGLAVRLDEPETLSPEWIDERKRLGHFQSGDGIYFGYFIKAEELQNQLVPKQDKPKKVVVPKFVGDWIDEYKDKGYSLSNAIFNIARGDEDLDIEEYFRENPRTYIDAWDNGYTVEEKKYEVILSAVTGAKDIYLVVDEDSKVYFESMDYIVRNGCLESEFTEKEIKAIDDRFWPFAEPVEEEEE